MVLLDVFLVHVKRIEVLVDDDTAEPKACGIQFHTFVGQVAAKERKDRWTAFQGEFRFTAAEVASELALADSLVDFLANHVRIVRSVLEHNACFGLEVNGGMHAEVRRTDMTFCIEDMERIGFAFLKSQGIQVHGTGHLTMLTTDIHHQPVVDEHPDVIIAIEVEVLARHVFKRCLDLHGEAEVVTATIMSCRSRIVIGIRNGLRFVEILEIIQQEHTIFIDFVTLRNGISRYFCKPETFVIHRNVKVAASHVGVLIALVVCGENFGQEPVSQMFGNLAIFGERCCRNRDAVFAEDRFNHAAHGATATATRTEVSAHAVFRVSVSTFAIALVAMQPVKHHDREFFQRAVTQNACGALGIDFWGTFLVTLDPNGVTQGSHGIEADFSCSSRFNLGKAFGANKVAANRLLKIDVQIFGSINRGNKPTAILVHGGHLIRFTVQV